MAPGPTVAAMQLGVTLRRRREARQMTGADAARAIGGSPAKISRIEGGRTQVEQRDITRLLDLYGITERAAAADPRLAELRAELLDLAELSCQDDSWTELSDLLPVPVRHLLALEAESSLITTYDQAVPPMVQTDAYARAAASALNPDSPRWRGGLGIRVLTRRRGVLKALAPPTYWALIQESALRRSPSADPAVMRGQLASLARQAAERKVTIQVVPDDTGMALNTPGPFSLLRFHHPDVPSVVLQEAMTTIRASWTPAEVDACHLIFNSLAAKALTPDASAALITRLLDELPPGPAPAGTL
jgi:transcriptional regulator with XRE-family HTH domain